MEVLNTTSSKLRNNLCPSPGHCFDNVTYGRGQIEPAAAQDHYALANTGRSPTVRIFSKVLRPITVASTLAMHSLYPWGSPPSYNSTVLRISTFELPKGASGNRYWSEAMSMTKRYFTSLLRSRA